MQYENTQQMHAPFQKKRIVHQLPHFQCETPTPSQYAHLISDKKEIHTNCYPLRANRKHPVNMRTISNKKIHTNHHLYKCKTPAPGKYAPHFTNYHF